MSTGLVSGSSLCPRIPSNTPAMRAGCFPFLTNSHSKPLPWIPHVGWGSGTVPGSPRSGSSLSRSPLIESRDVVCVLSTALWISLTMPILAVPHLPCGSSCGCKRVTVASPLSTVLRITITPTTRTLLCHGCTCPPKCNRDLASDWMDVLPVLTATHVANSSCRGQILLSALGTSTSQRVPLGIDPRDFEVGELTCHGMFATRASSVSID
mmetsp:Transcript_42415/g.99793  ORF Transcript_42415/g.99793 Transcript_42415/m.99793 type:complete len:210 (-) Transcript_42415:281-910(-)